MVSLLTSFQRAACLLGLLVVGACSREEVKGPLLSVANGDVELQVVNSGEIDSARARRTGMRFLKLWVKAKSPRPLSFQCTNDSLLSIPIFGMRSYVLRKTPGSTPDKWIWRVGPACDFTPFVTLAPDSSRIFYLVYSGEACCAKERKDHQPNSYSAPDSIIFRVPYYESAESPIKQVLFCASFDTTSKRPVAFAAIDSLTALKIVDRLPGQR